MGCRTGGSRTGPRGARGPAPPDPGGLGQGPSAFRQVFTSLFIPDGTTEQIQWFNELQRVSATPENAAPCVPRSAVGCACAGAQVRPTWCCTAPRHADSLRRGSSAASLIPGARFVPIEPEPSHPRAGAGVASFRRGSSSFLGIPLDAAEVSEPRRHRIQALFDKALDLSGGAARSSWPEGARGIQSSVARWTHCWRRPNDRRDGEARRRAGQWAGRALHIGPHPRHFPVRDRRAAGWRRHGGRGKARDRRLQRLVALKFLLRR